MDQNNDNNTIKKFGFSWRVGRNWGIAHPNDICYNDRQSIYNTDDHIRLGIDYAPKDLEVNGNIKRYDWSVGYISTEQTIKYGYLRVDFKLPVGRHIWPAIWLTDGKTWPPEIDIVEGTTDSYSWPILKPNTGRRMYRANPFMNRIFPSCHLGTKPEEHIHKSYAKFRGTCPCYLDILGDNYCEIIWAPNRILIYYNGHKVMDEKDPDVLKYYNQSSGMEIHLNNYVTNGFKMIDLMEMKDHKRKGFTDEFLIYDLKYDPDYAKYLYNF